MAPETTAAPVIEAHAMSRHVRVSPQKARLVLDLIRGQRAETALGILRFTPKRVAKHIEKILRSAIANAERKADDAGESLDVDHLYVARCFANEGPRWKRLRPAPMGRAFRYQKRTAHIVVGVAEHVTGAEERAASAAAEASSRKGVKGAVKKAREAITGQQRRGGRKPAKSQAKPDSKKGK
jgi:large subunit ribosomal protein L22